MNERDEQERDLQLEEIIRQANMLTKNGGISMPPPLEFGTTCVLKRHGCSLVASSIF